jgi:hypothetical protein
MPSMVHPLTALALAFLLRCVVSAGSTAAAKAWRLAEAGLWVGAVPHAAANATEPTGWLTYDASLTGDEWHSAVPGMGAHINASAAHMVALRGALGWARALGRGLLLPPLACYCDRVWGGHDNVFRNGCMYPGSQDGKWLPAACPLDHWISPTLLAAEAGVAVQPFADRTFDAPAGPARVELQGAPRPSKGTLLVPVGVSAEAARQTLAPVANAPLLVLGVGVAAAFGGFKQQNDHADFLARTERAIAPQRWCSECHPMGCAALLSSEVLALGEVSPSREVHDKFCVDFKRPEPLPWPPKAKGAAAGRKLMMAR